MGSAVPIAAKFAFADVQQPEGFPWSGSVADIKSLGTHKWLLLRQRTKNIKIKARYQKYEPKNDAALRTFFLIIEAMKKKCKP
ncbi:MAG: hypothetical protein ACLU19_05210 [Faecalibacterium sp.]